MTRWLLNPLTWFFVAHALVALLDVRLAARAQVVGIVASWLQNLLICYLLAAWVQSDARSRRTTFPTDWSMLFCMVFFPVYLLSTRGPRGMGMLLLIVAGMFLIHWLVFTVGWWLLA